MTTPLVFFDLAPSWRAICGVSGMAAMPSACCTMAAGRLGGLARAAEAAVLALLGIGIEGCCASSSSLGRLPTTACTVRRLPLRMKFDRDALARRVLATMNDSV